jgi:CHRD domain
MAHRRAGVLVVPIVAVALVAFVQAASGQSSAGSSGKALTAVMNGKKEVDNTGKKGTGDTDGRGAFGAVIKGSSLCYGLTVVGVDKPVASHIHKGGSNVAGPVVIPLKQPSSGDPGSSGACTTAKTSLLKDILAHPGSYYVNIHTSKFPGGAVRAQLVAGS